MAGMVVLGMETLAGAARGQDVEAIVTASRLAGTTAARGNSIVHRLVDSAVARFEVGEASMAVGAGSSYFEGLP
jgi:hypothetical protein